MALVVLSPHFDDAVLSCWHVIGGCESVVVVNVFAGVPPAGSPLGWWDHLTGALDSTARATERADEDRAALALAGRVPVNLELLEAQYRRWPPLPGAIAERIAAEASRCDVVYAPAALSGHPDHALVRNAALRLRAAVARVRLYADLPHGLSRGWPTWVSSHGIPAVDEQWADALAGAGTDCDVLHPRVHVLGPRGQQRKLAAVRSYRSQVAALEEMAFAPLERILRYEVVWELVPA